MSNVTVMNLSNPSHKIQYSCSPREAVIAAYAQNLHPSGNSIGDWNTWNYEKNYGGLVLTGKYTICCGDFSAFLDGRSF